MGKIIDFIRAVAGKGINSEETNLAYIIANRDSILRGANNEELMKEPKAAEMLLARYDRARSNARRGFKRIAIRGKLNSSNEGRQNEGRQKDGRKKDGRQKDGEELIL